MGRQAGIGPFCGVDGIVSRMAHHLGDCAAATKDSTTDILTTPAGLSFGNAVVRSHHWTSVPNSRNHVEGEEKLSCLVNKVTNQCVDSDLEVVEDQNTRIVLVVGSQRSVYSLQREGYQKRPHPKAIHVLESPGYFTNARWPTHPVEPHPRHNLGQCHYSSVSFVRASSSTNRGSL